MTNVSQIIFYFKEKKLFAKSTNILAGKVYNQYKILVFLAYKLYFSLTFY